MNNDEFQGYFKNRKKVLEQVVVKRFHDDAYVTAEELKHAIDESMKNCDSINGFKFYINYNIDDACLMMEYERYETKSEYKSRLLLEKKNDEYKKNYLERLVDENKERVVEILKEKGII